MFNLVKFVVTLSENRVSCRDREVMPKRTAEAVVFKPVRVFSRSGKLSSNHQVVMKSPSSERIIVEVIPCFLVWETNSDSLWWQNSDRESLSGSEKSLVVIAILCACVSLL